MKKKSSLMNSLRKKIATFLYWRNRKIGQKRSAPNTLFPVRNNETANVVWFETNATVYGLFVAIHREKPQIKTIRDLSRHTAMAGVHIDYFISTEEGEKEVEQIKLQLYDALVGPYDDAHWQIPDDYSRYPDASIILVRDVQSWKPDPDDVPAPKKHHAPWPDKLRWKRRIAD